MFSPSAALRSARVDLIVAFPVKNYRVYALRAVPLFCTLARSAAGRWDALFILRIDPTLERSSNGDSHVTRDPAAARREVSELTLTAHQPNLGEKLAEQLDGHTTMPAFIGLSFLS
jgi:hypothetical protein